MIGLLYRLGDAARRLARRRRWAAGLASGRLGEDLAHRFLRRRGYTVVARNYRPPEGAGEIDLIAWDRDTLVFVEVKSRSTDEFGDPDRSVDRYKMQRLERVARDYVRRAEVPWDRTRFEIVNVILGEPPQIELLPNGFRLSRTI